MAVAPPPSVWGSRGTQPSDAKYSDMFESLPKLMCAAPREPYTLPSPSRPLRSTPGIPRAMS